VVAWLLLSCESLSLVVCASCWTNSIVYCLCASLHDKLDCLCASLLDKLGPMLTKTNKGRLPTKVSFQLHLLFFVIRFKVSRSLFLF